MMSRRLILSFLACFVLSTAQAQKFELVDMFRSIARRDDKRSVDTCKPVYGTQWTLKTDGYNVTTDWDVVLHMGSKDYSVGYVEIESVEFFDHVDSIKVDALLRDSYTITIKVDDTTIVYKKNKADEDYVTHPFSFNGVTGKVSVRFEFPSFRKKQMYLRSIEVVTRLKDKENIKDPDGARDTTLCTVNRTFSKDYWNTICLPFDVKAEDLHAIFGNGNLLRKFTGEVKGNTMIFSKASEIKAGEPYLLKPAKTVKNPTFTNVVCTEKTPHVVEDPTRMFSFVGTYDPVKLKTDGSELFLGYGDRLYKPLPSDRQMYGMRAFFKIRSDAHAATKPYYAIAFEDKTTGITLHQDKTSDSDRIYTLQGVSVTADFNRLAPGIYIRNGKKIYICN
mgnify:CR=1 FL=1